MNDTFLSFAVVIAEPFRTAPIGTRCMFPFVYNSVTYNNCTSVGSDEGNWCYVNTNGDYGYCHYRSGEKAQNFLFIGL